MQRGCTLKSEKVGSEDFKCMSCALVKPLRQRHGKVCCGCVHKRYVSTTEGALRFRYTMKKSKALRKAIPFNLTFDQYKRQYEKQNGKDGYTGEQMTFDFGLGLSRATVSLDRIDNEVGYVLGNIMFCCHGTNSKKGTRSVRRLFEQLEFNFSIEASGDCQPKSEEVSNLEKTI